MDPVKAIDQLYYSTILNEPRMMNGSNLYHNITYNSLLYLDLISYTENCATSFLAGVLRIVKPSVTLKINELTKQGLIERRQSGQDRRVYSLVVWPEILEESKKLDQATNYAIEQVKKQYTSGEMSRSCKILDAFSSYYNDYCRNTTRAKGDPREPESN